MEDYPHTLKELESRFPNEARCGEYLYRLRWPNGFICPACSTGKAWHVNNTLYECCNCGRQQSVIAGTIFQDTHVPLATWFRAAWWVCAQKNGASALGLKQVLGIGSYRTAWMLLHKLRFAMVRPGREKLHGTIEVDESLVGGKKAGKRGRGASGKSIVMIAVEDLKAKGFGRIRLEKIEDATEISIKHFIAENISTGSIIRTDGFKSYSGVEKCGCQHIEVAGFSKVGEENLPLVHRVASLLKRWILGTHQGSVSVEHLQAYLNEFTFRFNRRKSGSRGKLFLRIMESAVLVKPEPYSKIIKNVR
jgi:transposase-like protein